MRKILIFLLAMTVFLTACGPNTPDAETQPTESTVTTAPPPTRPPVEVPEVEEVPVDEDIPFDFAECADLIGSWTLTVNISSNYLNIPDFTGSASFPLTFHFTDDGRYTVTLEQESYEAAIIGYENLLADFMITGYYNKFVAEKQISNLSNKEIQARWEQSELANAQKKAHGYLDDLALGATFAQLVRAGYYYAEDGVLYLSVGDDYETFQYTIDEEGLILSKSSRIRYYTNLCIYFPSALKPQ